VISTHLYDTSYVDTALKDLPDVTAMVGASHYRAGTLMADYAIVNSNARVHALFITSNEVQPSAGIASAFSSELTRRCPKTCQATVVNVPIADWATKVPTAVQTALIKSPSINYVVPVFDGMTPFLVTGITQVGKNGSVHIVAYNGTASVLQMIQRKNLVIADIGEPLEWLGWANIDEALRVLSGAAPLKNEQTPLRLFDASNVNDAGRPANQTSGYGDSGNFKSGFKKLWGLSS
jgi:ABC-type sugar transport system, periplasmic component